MATYRWLGVGAVVALALQAYGAGAQDDDDGPRGGVFCSSPIGNTRVEGDLHVIGRCTLAGTEVRGDVRLWVNGSLTARDARIRGDLEGSGVNRNANFVDLQNSRIDGRVELEGLVGDLTTFEGSEIHGNVALTANRSELQILNNNFRRDVVASQNDGGLEISGNLFEEDLLCDGNEPPPKGVGNRVEGEAEGQCANLGATDPPPAPAPTPPPPAPTPPPPAPTPAPAPAPEPAPPPVASPPPAAAPPATDVALEDGGAGAMGWLTLLLLPLLVARRRLARR